MTFKEVLEVAAFKGKLPEVVRTNAYAEKGWPQKGRVVYIRDDGKIRGISVKWPWREDLVWYNDSKVRDKNFRTMEELRFAS